MFADSARFRICSHSSAVALTVNFDSFMISHILSVDFGWRHISVCHIYPYGYRKGKDDAVTSLLGSPLLSCSSEIIFNSLGFWEIIWDHMRSRFPNTQSVLTKNLSKKEFLYCVQWADGNVPVCPLPLPLWAHLLITELSSYINTVRTNGIQLQIRKGKQSAADVYKHLRRSKPPLILSDQSLR